ncbi:MAG: hypothetical protein RL186_1376 [Pseudomonadota bacterium]
MRGSRDCGDGMQRGRIATRTFAPPQAGELVSAANLRGCSLRQEAPSVRFAATSPAKAGEDKVGLPHPLFPLVKNRLCGQGRR